MVDEHSVRQREDVYQRQGTGQSEEDVRMKFEDFKKLKLSRKHPGDEEHRLQCDCVSWFKLTFPDFARVFFAVPNGGRRDASTGRRLKEEGVTAGVADLLFLHARGGFYGLAIELKTARGRQSEEQKAWQEEVECQCYKYSVVRSFDEFEKLILDYFDLNETIANAL